MPIIFGKREQLKRILEESKKQCRRSIKSSKQSLNKRNSISYKKRKKKQNESIVDVDVEFNN